MNAVTPETTGEGFELKPGSYTFGRLTRGHEQEGWLPDNVIDIEVGANGQLRIKPNENSNKVCIVSICKGGKYSHYILADELSLGALLVHNENLYESFDFLLPLVEVEVGEDTTIDITICNNDYNQIITKKRKELRRIGREEDILFNYANQISPYNTSQSELGGKIKGIINTSFHFFVNSSGNWSISEVDDIEGQHEDLSTKPADTSSSIPLLPAQDEGGPTRKINNN